jgi:VWFA-related protein
MKLPRSSAAVSGLQSVVWLMALAASALAVSQQPQFRAGVDVVELNVAVSDGKKVVTDLTASDFEVLDNGVRQQVISVTRESLPVDVTLVVDTSESLSSSMQVAVRSAAGRIRSALRPADRMALITFNQRIQERFGLAPASGVPAVDFELTTGRTSLNDALAVVLAAKPVTDRRQMAIIFTDGYDSTSLLTEEDILTMAGRSHTSMFFVARQGSTLIIGRAPTTFKPPVEHRQPITFFYQIAAATGGLVQIVPSMNVTSGGNWIRIGPNTNLLDDLFLNALIEFRAGYLVRYSLEGVPRAGRHEVTVRITRPGTRYSVRTRNGYIG